MKLKLTGIVFFLFLLVGLLGFVYPYSQISFLKSTTYQPDKVFVSEYTKKLNELAKSTQGNTSENEQIAVAINQIIENLKEPWLTSKESTQITLKDINNQISQLEGIKQKLVVIDNAEAKKSNSNTRTLLLDLIKDTDALTSELGAMKDANFDTRNQLGTQFGNIHMAFAQYLNKTTAFYESYKTGK